MMIFEAIPRRANLLADLVNFADIELFSLAELVRGIGTKKFHIFCVKPKFL